VDYRTILNCRLEPGAGRNFLVRARALDARARARGASLVSFEASSLAFAFDDPNDLATALDLVLVPGDDTCPGEVPWAAGIAYGALERFAESGGRSELGWGPALVASSLLARAAMPGEVLCSRKLPGVHTGELRTKGARTARQGTLRVRGVLLDVEEPWRDMKLSPSLKAEPTSTPPTTASDAPPQSSRQSSPQSSRQPLAQSSSHPPSTPTSRVPLRTDSESPPSSVPTSLATSLGEVARRVLSTIPPPSIKISDAQVTCDLTASPIQSTTGARMRAFSMLDNGEIDDALRALRSLRSEIQSEDHRLRCQATLAIAVALSVGGNVEEALVEGMEALGCSRHAHDAKGERACLAFLAKLFASAGRIEASRLRHAAPSMPPPSSAPPSSPHA